MADSIATGYGARVKGGVPPWAIKGRYQEPVRREAVSAAAYLPESEDAVNRPDQKASQVC